MSQSVYSGWIYQQATQSERLDRHGWLLPLRFDLSFAWPLEPFDRGAAKLLNEVHFVRSQLQSTIVLVERLAEIYPHYGQSELLRTALLLILRQTEESVGAATPACADED